MTDQLFFEPSALVKRYAEERGTETVDRLIESTDATVYVTSIAVVSNTSPVLNLALIDRLDLPEETRVGSSRADSWKAGSSRAGS